MSSYLPTTYQQFIATSRYSRWLDDENRRETWEESVSRYFTFFEERLEKQGKLSTFVKSKLDWCKDHVLNLNVMPSMRCLMTAGKALERDNVAAFNCSYIAVDHPHVFDEILYILCCLHPDTLVKTKDGPKAIKDITVDDLVLTYNEQTKQFKYVNPSAVIENDTSLKEKMEIEFEDGTKVRCTSDHKFLTNNRGWVEAKDLTELDDIVDDRKYSIYKIENTKNGKVYVGYTSQLVMDRFSEHVYSAKHLGDERALCRAIRKYGEESFIVSTLDKASTKSEALKREIEWIERLSSFGKNGYNLTIGGEGATGAKWSEEAKRRASLNAYPRTEQHRAAAGARLKVAMPGIIKYRQSDEYRMAQRNRNLGEKNPMYGKKMSEARKDQLSREMSGEGNPFFGKRHTEEVKQLLSSQRIGLNAGESNPFFGKKHSEETRAKMKQYWADRRQRKAAN